MVYLLHCQRTIVAATSRWAIRAGGLPNILNLYLQIGLWWSQKSEKYYSLRKTLKSKFKNNTLIEFAIKIRKFVHLYSFCQLLKRDMNKFSIKPITKPRKDVANILAPIIATASNILRWSNLLFCIVYTSHLEDEIPRLWLVRDWSGGKYCRRCEVYFCHNGLLSPCCGTSLSHGIMNCILIL